MTTPSKIVQLGEVRSAARQAADARLPAPLLKLRDRSEQHLGQILQKVMSQLDDSLFGLADKADSNTTQQTYFDAMREIRLKKDGIVARFGDELKAGFSQIERSSTTADSAQSQNQFDSLSLLQNDELEERVAIESMAARAESALQRELGHLNLRFDALYVRGTVDSGNNPLGPRLVLKSFQVALQILDVTIEPKLIAYKLFEKTVLAGLKALYDAANRYLAEQGVLPDIHNVTHQSRRQQGAHPGNTDSGAGRPGPAREPVRGSAGPKRPSGGVPTLYDSHAIEQGSSVPMLTNQASSHVSYSALPAEALSLIRTLSSQGQRHFSIGGERANSEHLSAGELTTHSGQSLQSLEHGALIKLLTQAQQRNELATTYQNTQGLLSFEGLLQSMLQTSGGGRTGLASLDQDVMNLVTMLFEYILNDKQLQAPVKALIGRLQIPVLKVALLDKRFFADADHSARRLLNTLATASIGWIEDTSLEKDPFLGKLGEIVDRLVNDFVDDPGVFDEVLTDFVRFRDTDKRRRQLLEQRTRDAEAGKARAEHARAQVDKALEFALRNAALSLPTRELIRDGWCNYMVLLALKQGTSSKVWIEATEVAQRLCELDLGCYEIPEDIRAAFASTIDKSAISGAVDVVIGELRSGLQQTGYKPFDLETHLDNFAAHLVRRASDHAAFDDKTAATAPSSTALASGPNHDQGEQSVDEKDKHPSANAGLTAGADSELKQTAVVDKAAITADAASQQIVDDEKSEASSTQGLQQTSETAGDAPVAPRAPSEGSLALVRNMRIGLWVEVHGAEDSSTPKLRCKLAAILQTTGKYIFVNRMGVKVLERTRDALAMDLGDGKVTLLDDSLLFDRALEAVIGSLRNESQH